MRTINIKTIAHQVVSACMAILFLSIIGVEAFHHHGESSHEDDLTVTIQDHHTEVSQSCQVCNYFAHHETQRLLPQFFITLPAPVIKTFTLLSLANTRIVRYLPEHFTNKAPPVLF